VDIASPDSASDTASANVIHFFMRRGSATTLERARKSMYRGKLPYQCASQRYGEIAEYQRGCPLWELVGGVRAVPHGAGADVIDYLVGGVRAVLLRS
jgi:hypothetical protein